MIDWTNMEYAKPGPEAVICTSRAGEMLPKSGLAYSRTPSHRDCREKEVGSGDVPNLARPPAILAFMSNSGVRRNSVL